MVEKKKSYEFFMAPDPNSILLTDELLGSRLSPLTLTFTFDE